MDELLEAPRASGERARRRTWPLAAVLVLGLGAATLVAAHDATSTSAPGPARAGSNRSGAPPAQSSPSPQGSTRPSALALARDTAVRQLLSRRGAAVTARSRSAWLADVDPRADDYRRAQQRTFDGLAALRFSEWSYELGGEGPELLPARGRVLGRDATIVRVVLTYRLAGFDVRRVRRDHYLTVTRHSGRWWFAGDDDGTPAGATTERDVWDLGAVDVARGRRTLVIAVRPEGTARPRSRGGSSGAAALRRYAREGDRAVDAVSAVWTRPWSRSVVIIVPSRSQQLVVLSGRAERGGLEQLAAVTTGRTIGDGTTFGDRIVINPQTYPGLPATARRVVMAHETTHVATRQWTRAGVPQWLAEGFADYVGYRDVGVPVTVAAGDLLSRVRRGALPTRLPTDADFAATGGDLDVAYNGAWLACRALAAARGERALVDVYTATARAGPAGLTAALAALGLDEDALLALWHRHLAELAR